MAALGKESTLELGASFELAMAFVVEMGNEFLRRLPSVPFDYGERFYFVYIFSFVGFAYVAYRLYHKDEAPFWRFLFPKSIYLHASAKIDYLIYLINLFLTPLTSLFGAALNTAATVTLLNALLSLNGGQPLSRGEWSDQINWAFILGFTLAADLAVYVTHRFHHWSSIFWPLHALHHSAEVMTPVTLFRKHPLWNVSANLVTAALTGLFQALFVFAFFGKPDYTVLLGINTLYVVFNFFASNLRHSHVWLSWGKPLSYLFISPAMHQIHHDPTRMNKNYGEIFAIWDWLFGSLYIPEQRERFTIGLGDGEDNPHRSLAKAYYVPIENMTREFVKKLTFSRRNSA